MNFKKLISIMLCFCMFLVTGCKKSDKDSSSKKPGEDTVSTVSSEINMLYSSKDTLNPFTCVTTQNKVLTQLMYDSLLVLKNNYETEYKIAKNITYENKVLSILLSDVKFTDGTPLTAADVVFSFEAAKKSKNYSSSLNFAVSAVAEDPKHVTITLSRDDPYFVNLLTFPIIKSGSDTLTDSDNRLLPPIGSGRYIFDVDAKKLTVNKNHNGGVAKIDSVAVTDCPDNESISQTLSIGAIDFYFTDLGDDVIPKMNGTAADVTQSRIVFLGVNPQSSRLSDVYFRQAVSAALNRTEICTTAYYSKAVEAKGPFPNSWKEVANIQTIDVKPNLQTVDLNIKLAGFGQKDEKGFYTDKSNNPIGLTLLVSSDNLCRLSAAQIIKKNLENSGIKINLVSLSNNSFRAELSAGRYDLYLGETNIHNNLDLGHLVKLNSARAFLSGAAAQTASSDTSSKKTENNTSSQTASQSEVVSNNLSTAEIYNGFYKGTYNVTDIVTVFNAELPVIPVCFRNGLVIYSKRLGNGINPVISDLFNNIENIK